ncbi:hypothetical protein [Halorubrum vacuolatum]|uniref:Uncharacterized protein n=1 Tax=Halorubrum vacuolatum TaxID=63740 RepID=A0A238VQE2_HALVU|nr:hypothetical protein [Halorubrum vacuolatum]SNR36364.1 hypothetical protein SAMN06264855_103259 [Halorubrum vacuolatum]
MTNNNQPKQKDGLTEDTQRYRSNASSASEYGSTLRLAPSRRGLLGAFAATGAVAGGIAWFGVGNTDMLPVSQEDEQEEDETADRDLLLDLESEIRKELHDDRASVLPSFEYDPIDEQLGHDGVERVVAEPLDTESGDRLVLLANDDAAQTIMEMFVSQWADSTESSGEYDVSINDEEVTFEVFAGSTLYLGIAVRDSSTAEEVELLAARGTDEGLLEEAIDGFVQMYTTLE